MGTTSRTWFLIIIINVIQLVTAQELEKRAPQGFLGMRGKKYMMPGESQQYYKRRPTFIGVKGKKDEVPELEFIKRAPLGFVGMRGKKEYFPDKYYENYDFPPKQDGSMIGQIEYSTGDNFKDPDFSLLKSFLAEYLEKLKSDEGTARALEDNIREAKSESNELIENEISKRAANFPAYFGIRGKKSLKNKRPFDLALKGRFISVRGKKDVSSDEDQESKSLSDEKQPWIKRKQMAFIGMRGKKWGDDQSSMEMESPN